MKSNVADFQISVDTFRFKNSRKFAGTGTLSKIRGDRYSIIKRGPTPVDTYYDVLDLAPYLKKGENTVAVLLWYFGKEGFSHKDSGKAGLIFQADLGDASLLSGPSWKAIQHPAFGNTAPPHPNFRLPESNIHFDARKEMEGWQQPGFDDSGWQGATELAMCVPNIFNILKGHREASAEEIVLEGLAKNELSEEDLESLRKNDSRMAKIALKIRYRTTLKRGKIAKRVKMGSLSSVTEVIDKEKYERERTTFKRNEKYPIPRGPTSESNIYSGVTLALDEM